MTHPRAALRAVTACLPGYGMLLAAAFAAMPALDAAIDLGALRAGHWPLIILAASHAAIAAALIRYRRQQRAQWQRWRDGGGKIIAGGRQDAAGGERAAVLEDRCAALESTVTDLRRQFRQAYRDAGWAEPDDAQPGLRVV